MQRLSMTVLTACSLFAAACGAPDPSSTGQTQEEVKHKKKCHSDNDCASLEFCDTEAARSCNSTGVCTPRGINLLCTNASPTVCGCDGQDYPGACYAHKAGVSVDHKGACAGTCLGNSDCGSLQYCATDAGQCGAQGVCKARGINQLCFDLYKPVCGCDGKTYANTCYAAKAGAAIDHDGACACDFKGTNIDGDTLAEQPWMNQSQSLFYTFTGNGTAVNNSGTVVSTFSPACLRTTPHCAIATRFKNGTFTTNGPVIDISYDDGTTASFSAEIDCNNTYQLVGNDWGGSQTLVISTVQPTP